MYQEIVHFVKCKGTETVFQVRKIRNDNYDVMQDSPTGIVYFPQQFDDVREAVEFAETLAQVFEDGYEQGCCDCEF